MQQDDETHQRDVTRIITVAVREARDNTLEAAIRICEDFAKEGAGAEACVRALKDLQSMLPLIPGKQN